MGEFNSDDHYIYYCGQESLRRNGVAIMVNKRVRNAVLGCSLKNDRKISVRLQGKPFNITAILISDKIDFEIKAMKRDKEGHCIIIKGSIQEEDIKIINIYAPTIGAL